MASYIPQRPPDSVWADAQQQAASRGLPSLPDVLPAQRSFNYESLLRPALSVGAQLFPPLAMGKSLWDAGSGGIEGYSRGRYGDTATQYGIGTDGNGGQAPTEVGKPSTISSLFKWLNPARAAGYGVGYGAGAASRPTIEANPNLPGYSQPAVSLFDQLIASTRPLAPRTASIENSARSAAERSLFEAYSKGSKYDTTGKGWVADPSRDAPQTASLFPAATGGGSSSGGGYSPWYAGQPDPYSATGNMLDRITNYDFGVGRYDNASNPYSSLWGSDSMDTPMFGPGARFVHGDKFNTD